MVLQPGAPPKQKQGLSGLSLPVSAQEGARRAARTRLGAPRGGHHPQELAFRKAQPARDCRARGRAGAARGPGAVSPGGGPLAARQAHGGIPSPARRAPAGLAARAAGSA